MKYLYENHMGGFYTQEQILEFSQLYCEQCGDTDTLIGSFENIKDF